MSTDGNQNEGLGRKAYAVFNEHLSPLGDGYSWGDLSEEGRKAWCAVATEIVVEAEHARALYVASNPGLPELCEDPLAAIAQGISYLCVSAGATELAKGFRALPRSFGDVLSHLHSEVSEAFEDWRSGRKPTAKWHEDDGKPRGVPFELADVVIKACTIADDQGINLAEAIDEKLAWNAERPRTHGGKRC